MNENSQPETISAFGCCGNFSSQIPEETENKLARRYTHPNRYLLSDFSFLHFAVKISTKTKFQFAERKFQKADFRFQILESRHL